MCLSLQESLDRIDELMKEHPEQVRFNPPATIAAIQAFENESGMSIPSFYKEFLLRFNGGYFCASNLIDSPRDTAAWNSNVIFCLEELDEKYWELCGQKWKMTDYKYLYPFLPFCRTNVQELLIFVSPFLPCVESPVFDAFHESSPQEWGLLYQDFEDFLDEFVANSGAINLTAESDYPSAYGWINWMDLKEYWEDQKK